MSSNDIIKYANDYFDRNVEVDKKICQGTKYLCDLLKNENIESVCEVGCFTGTQLNYVCTNLNAKGVGIEPSGKAIENGKEKYENLKLIKGFSVDLQIKDESQDLIMFGFFSYLLPDNDYKKSINEAYKKLKKGKFFYILDFDNVSHNTCKHNNKFIIYKRDYSYIKGFKLLEKKSYYNIYEKNNNSSYADDYSRKSIWLFKKQD